MINFNTLYEYSYASTIVYCIILLSYITCILIYKRVKLHDLHLIPFSDSLLADIQKRITDAFDIFDNENNKTVDVRFVHCIIHLF